MNTQKTTKEEGKKEGQTRRISIPKSVARSCLVHAAAGDSAQKRPSVAVSAALPAQGKQAAGSSRKTLRRASVQPPDFSTGAPKESRALSFLPCSRSIFFLLSSCVNLARLALLGGLWCPPASEQKVSLRSVTHPAPPIPHPHPPAGTPTRPLFAPLDAVSPSVDPATD